MFERFSHSARTVVLVAREQAVALGHDSMGNQHLLLGLLATESGAAAEALREVGLRLEPVRALVQRRDPAGGALTSDDAESLRALGIDLDVVLGRLEASFGPASVPSAAPHRGRLGVSRPTKKTLQLTLREAIWLKAPAIGTEHLLLGLVRCDDPDITAILADMGTTPNELRAATLRAIGRAA